MGYLEELRKVKDRIPDLDNYENQVPNTQTSRTRELIRRQTRRPNRRI